MQKCYSSEFFNATDTLSCGQVFRFYAYKEGFILFSLDKACYVYTKGTETFLQCNDDDEQYFERYFDLDRDYSLIVKRAKKFGGITEIASNFGKGIRILNQDTEETLFSFIVSQNNNIPRIKSIIEKLCNALGEEREFFSEIYHAFPTAEIMAEQDIDFFYSIGLGYRAPYIKKLAQDIVSGTVDINKMSNLPTIQLKKTLVQLYGVGSKVADCVILFGFHHTDAFPVDTWMEKVYKEDFNGNLVDREKIAQGFVEKFGEDSGYFQQYMFYYKRGFKRLTVLI